MDQSIVAMIDGGSVAFAVASKRAALTLDRVWRGKTADYPTFIDALQQYLKLHGLQPRDYGFAIAVAGVPRGDIISLANCRWFISVSGLRSFLRTEPLFLNECAATAWSLTALNRSSLTALGKHPPRPLVPGSTFLVVAAGCGLGVATIHITAGGEMIVMPSEGGHGSFAPMNPAEDALLPHLRQQFGHVSYERILAEVGPGNIYRALAARDGKRGEEPPFDTITSAARQRTDPIAIETLKLFTGVLGSFLGSATLTVSAWDGVFLVGDMLHKMQSYFTQPEFRAQFQAKGRMARLLENVPIALVNSGETQLLGAAAALLARQGPNDNADDSAPGHATAA